MQMNDEALMSIVKSTKENKMPLDSEDIGNELDFFFSNVMDTVVDYFTLETV